jgi:hypothetical protein
MATIDTSYFYGELSIAQISQAEIAASLQIIIDSREDELLLKLLGYELYKAYKAGVIATTQKYIDIRDGKEYTDRNGNLTKWVGLKFAIGTAKKSLIANYVYWHYLTDNASFTTGSGEKKTDLAINVSPDMKMIRAWNEMVNWNIELHEFLMTKISDYPEYENVCIEKELFTYQNRFGL